MDHFLLAYIAQRMKELGFADYTFEAVRVKDAQITATNEYYYLIAKSILSSTLIIRSDTNIFNESGDYNNFYLYGIQEFTGVISLTDSNINYPIDYEFLRVIPRTNSSCENQKTIDNYLQKAYHFIKSLIIKK